MTSESTITEATNRLIASCDPERVYLFGSAARGSAHADSDLDFCVVFPGEITDSVARAGRRALHGLGAAIDVVFWTAGDFDARAAQVASSLPATVTREGKLLYDARRVAA